MAFWRWHRDDREDLVHWSAGDISRKVAWALVLTALIVGGALLLARWLGPLVGGYR